MTQHGNVPSREETGAFVTWLNESVRDGVYHTDCLPPAVETAFYRVLQETINNVVKHANATKVGIILEANENEVSLIVEDDGKGFVWDQLAESSSSRLGLLGMRERLALVGGSIEIESGHENGTVVIVHAPI